MRVVMDRGELKLLPIFFETSSWGCYAQIEIKIMIANCVKKKYNRISEKEHFSIKKFTWEFKKIEHNCHDSVTFINGCRFHLSFVCTWLKVGHCFPSVAFDSCLVISPALRKSKGRYVLD